MFRYSLLLIENQVPIPSFRLKPYIGICHMWIVCINLNKYIYIYLKLTVPILKKYFKSLDFTFILICSFLHIFYQLYLTQHRYKDNEIFE